MYLTQMTSAVYDKNFKILLMEKMSEYTERNYILWDGNNGINKTLGLPKLI